MSIKNVYCRVFQKTFAPFNKILNKRVPNVIHHKGALLDIPDVLKEKNINNPMIVTGPRISKSELFLAFCEKLEGRYTLYNEVKPDPPVSMIEIMVNLYKEKNCDGIIAIGGGSNIDAAKAMGARIARPKKSLSQMGGVMKVGKEIPFFIAVPTTAGTGSECTIAAVVTDDAIGKKYAVNDPVLCPDLAVLDPLLLVSLPASLTAYTGMDALTHAVEAYLNRIYHRQGTEETAMEAIKKVIDFLPKAYEDGTDIQAREEMLVASYKAGIVFSNACVGNVHAIAHAIGGQYHVQHGLANAIILPHVLREYMEANPHDLALLSRAMGLCDEESISDKRAAEIFIEKVEAMNESFSIPKNIVEIRECDIEKMAAWMEKEANPLYAVPVIFTRAKFEELLRKLMA